MPDTLSKLFKENFDPLVTKVEQRLRSWSYLPLSVAGRITSIKMSLLPEFTYLFQSFPVCIQKSFFHKLDGIISSFTWNYKTFLIWLLLPLKINVNTLIFPKLTSFTISRSVTLLGVFPLFPKSMTIYQTDFYHLRVSYEPVIVHRWRSHLLPFLSQYHNEKRSLGNLFLRNLGRPS